MTVTLYQNQSGTYSLLPGSAISISTTGQALIENFGSGDALISKDAVSGVKVIGPFVNKVRIKISALSGNVDIGDPQEDYSGLDSGSDEIKESISYEHNCIGAVTFDDAGYSASNPRVCASFDGKLYGYYSGTLYAQSEEGGEWVSLGTTPGNAAIIRLEKCLDGEVLALTTTSLHKSSGWGGSYTWTLKITNSGGNAVFTNFSGGGNGIKFIFSEYATGTPGSGYEYSQYAWGSVDCGSTWTVIYDAVERYDADASLTHIHGCNYDRYADIWILSEGHSNSKGMYWSPATLTPTWSKIERGDYTFPNGGNPTCVVPTKRGIALASDCEANGVYVIDKPDSLSDMSIRFVWEWVTGASQIAGFGAAYCYDEVNDLAYFGWTTNSGNGTPLIVTASDGASGWLAWKSSTSFAPVSASSSIDRIVVSPWGTLEASTSGEVGEKILRGLIKSPGAYGLRNIDSGGVLGGVRIGNVRSLSAGGNASANSGCVAIGARSIATSAIAVTEHLATAVGNSANAGYRSTCIGANTVGTNNDTVAVGESAQAGSTGGVSVGRAAVSGVQSVTIGRSGNSGSNAVGVGWSVNASANNTVAIGELAIASATGAVALGKSASAAHDRGVAIGRDTATSVASQVAIGPRHIEMEKIPADIGLPAAGKARLQILEVGGKIELSVQFPSGAKQVIATEP